MRALLRRSRCFIAAMPEGSRGIRRHTMFEPHTAVSPPSGLPAPTPLWVAPDFTAVSASHHHPAHSANRGYAMFPTVLYVEDDDHARTALSLISAGKGSRSVRRLRRGAAGRPAASRPDPLGRCAARPGRHLCQQVKERFGPRFWSCYSRGVQQIVEVVGDAAE